MITKKDLIIAILSTFCLTVTLFAVIPTRSQSPFTYDPWADINDDGKVDMKDIAYDARLFSTYGNPTKNVTITGHATKLIRVADWVNLSVGQSWVSDYIPVDGYLKVTINVYLGTPFNRLEVCASNGTGPWPAYLIDSIQNFAGAISKTYDVPHRYIYVTVENKDSSHTYALCVEVYLVA
jgi:hypothetical protein